jgi:MFS transporter, ACS family, glucarate transporter
MGIVGIVVSLIWLKVVYSPKDHPRLGREELGYIERGGALVDMDETAADTRAARTTDTGKSPLLATWGGCSGTG